MYTLFAPDYARHCEGHILGFSIDITQPHNFRALKDLWSNQFVQFFSRESLDELLLLIYNVNHEDIIYLLIFIWKLWIISALPDNVYVGNL